MSLQPASVSPPCEAVIDPNYKPLPGHLGNLTPLQQRALDTLKQQLKEEDHFVSERMDDTYLLGFLRSRKFDLPGTKAMLLSSEQWRKDFGVENLVKTFVFTERAKVDKLFPQYFHKTDKDGRPIYIRRLGKVDLDALNAITTEERQRHHFVVEYERFFSERLPACSKAVGHPVETGCTILDLDGATIMSFYRIQGYISSLTEIGNSYYPDCLGKFYIINPPWMFSTVWSIMKRWLDEDMVAKVEIVSSGVKDKLLSQIPAENLPVEFGGECRCVGGCSLSDAGPWNTHAQNEEAL